MQRELESQGIRSKITRSQKSGRARGGDALNRGALFHLLRNRTYLGEIVHGAESYPGLHPAIVDRDVFTTVGARLSLNTRERAKEQPASSFALLKGLIFDAEGSPMSPTVSQGHSGGSYRYYVSASAQQGKAAASKAMIRRVPAPQIEAFVTGVLNRLSPGADTVTRWRCVQGLPFS